MPNYLNLPMISFLGGEDYVTLKKKHSLYPWQATKRKGFKLNTNHKILG